MKLSLKIFLDFLKKTIDIFVFYGIMESEISNDS